MLDLTRYADHRNMVYALIFLGVTGFLLILVLGRLRFAVRTAISAALGWGWLCSLVTLTLVPVDLGGSSVNLVPFDRLFWDWFSILNFFLNILLFLPAGVLIAYSRVTPISLWVVAAIGLSTTIEVCQHYWGLGRAADVNDVIASTLGVAGGVLIAITVGILASRTSKPGTYAHN